MGLIILYFLGALSLSFLCSVLEAVLLSTPMSFISMKENQGNKVLKSVSDDDFQTRLSELMRPILSFSEDESLYQIWEKMLEKREHISIIVDEYGCLRGVVSMEDVIETMTGVEIVDEDDVAVDMQALAKEKSRIMMQKKK